MVVFAPAEPAPGASGAPPEGFEGWITGADMIGYLFLDDTKTNNGNHTPNHEDNSHNGIGDEIFC